MSYLEKYEEIFDDIFPTEEYPGLSLEEIESRAKECIEKNSKMHKLYPIDYKNNIY